MATILTKKSDTASAVPLAADLTNAAGGAELAVNATDKRLFSKTSGGTVVELGTNPTAMAVVGNTTVGGTLGVTGATTLAGVSATTLSASSTVTLSGGTANGVAYLNGSKVVTSGSALTFDGTDFSATGTTTVNSANSTQVALIVKGETGNGIRQRFIGQAASGQYNWQIGASITSAGSFAIIPSTAVDGTTFSTAAYAITGTGTSIWSVGGSEQMRLTSTGLGIGTSSPSFRLDVQAPTGVIKLTATTGTNASYFRADNSGGIVYFGLDDSTASTFGTAGAYGTVIQRPASTAFNINRAGTVDFYISTTGNVGIGTSSPTQLLNVRKDQAAYTWSRTENQSSSASAYAGLMLGAFGNSWGLAIGSSAANSNALTFILDAGGSNAEKMRLDSSGNLGLGVTPSAWQTGANLKALQVGVGTALFSDTNSLYLGNNVYQDSVGTSRYINTNYASKYQQTASSHQWYTAPSGTAGNAITFTQAMSLDADGWWYLGTTSTSTAGNAIVAYANSVAGQFSIGHANGTSSGNSYVGFQYNGSTIGSITQSGTTAVLYNVTSDKRLKNDLGVVKNTDVIANTVIHDFTWKSDGSQSRGVFAQEAAKTLPSAVKVGDEGKEVTEQWQVDYSKYIPDIIVELQSLRARVAELEAK